jgi:hypothetical protein
MIKGGLWIAAGLVVFALNWAALHDILQRRESDLRAEFRGSTRDMAATPGPKIGAMP